MAGFDLDAINEKIKHLDLEIHELKCERDEMEERVVYETAQMLERRESFVKKGREKSKLQVSYPLHITAVKGNDGVLSGKAGRFEVSFLVVPETCDESFLTTLMELKYFYVVKVLFWIDVPRRLLLVERVTPLRYVFGLKAAEFESIDGKSTESNWYDYIKEDLLRIVSQIVIGWTLVDRKGLSFCGSFGDSLYVDGQSNGVIFPSALKKFNHNRDFQDFLGVIRGIVFAKDGKLDPDIQSLLNFNYFGRGLSDSFLFLHPFFMDSRQRREFILEIFALMNEKGEFGYVMRRLLRKPNVVVNGESVPCWMEGLDGILLAMIKGPPKCEDKSDPNPEPNREDDEYCGEELGTKAEDKAVKEESNVGQQPLPTYNSYFDIIRFMRNTFQHVNELVDAFCMEAMSPEEIEMLLFRAFPYIYEEIFMALCKCQLPECSRFWSSRKVMEQQWPLIVSRLEKIYAHGERLRGAMNEE